MHFSLDLLDGNVQVPTNEVLSVPQLRAIASRPVVTTRDYLSLAERSRAALNVPRNNRDNLHAV
jgi:hypothetical protein